MLSKILFMLSIFLGAMTSYVCLSHYHQTLLTNNNHLENKLSELEQQKLFLKEVLHSPILKLLTSFTHKTKKPFQRLKSKKVLQELAIQLNITKIHFEFFPEQPFHLLDQIQEKDPFIVAPLKLEMWAAQDRDLYHFLHRFSQNLSGFCLIYSFKVTRQENVPHDSLMVFKSTVELAIISKKKKEAP